MPNNFRHIGLIHLMLPNAKIIDVRREPMACCFSNLKQLFATGQAFVYSIADIARYYRAYLDLMLHSDAVLPERVLRVFYEDLVADLDGNVKRILQFCGLGFEPACVEFYKTERSVRTPSSEVYRRRFVSTRLPATLLADGAPCFALCACPALVIKRDCSYISIHFSLEIAEISLPIASSGKSSGDSK
jgi:hypothetical protein